MERYPEAYKKQEIERALETQDWRKYLFAHDDADRTKAIIEIESRLSDIEYWKLVRLAWTQSDSLTINSAAWRELFLSSRGSRHELMEEEERQALDEQENSLLIYRGHTEFNPDGWSWTLSHTLAIKFAKTPDGWPKFGSPVVTQARVDKEKVIAFFTKLDEFEILIDPSDARRHESVSA